MSNMPNSNTPGLFTIAFAVYFGNVILPHASSALLGSIVICSEESIGEQWVHNDGQMYECKMPRSGKVVRPGPVRVRVTPVALENKGK